jgi:ABC-type sugar transport system permease subunit
MVGIKGISWIGDPDTAIYTLVALSIWQFGSPMIIFLAGLRQIPQDLYEASSLDGAGKIRQFWKITLPLLSPIIFFNAIIQTIEAFKAFTPAFIISEGTRRPGQRDALLHALSLSGGLRVLPHGLCGLARLGAPPHHRGLHRHLLHLRALLGAL